MCLDAVIIVMDSISLLKYTSLAIPDLEALIITAQEFISGTVRKTMVLIINTYVVFGLMTYFILAYYQYGFIWPTYALLRSCIVFLNGYVINE